EDKQGREQANKDHRQGRELRRGHQRGHRRERREGRPLRNARLQPPASHTEARI
ncbi:MAG: hypothetical protein AVDCRST_MAG28-2827, partial [uncultured Rubrobacteraceae bacterium]